MAEGGIDKETGTSPGSEPGGGAAAESSCLGWLHARGRLPGTDRCCGSPPGRSTWI